MLMILAFLLYLGAGIVGGVFFAFSTFVMQALAQLPAGQGRGIAAMQRINLVVLNPLFLGTFMGSAGVAALCMLFGLWYWGEAGAVLTLAAGACYLLGCFGVTVACNVPRNERLARLDGESAEAAAYWSLYLHEWQRWNHVRTIAALLAAAAAAAALALAA